MRKLRVSAVTLLYLALFGAALYAWLAQRLSFTQLQPLEAGLCAAPVLVSALWLGRAVIAEAFAKEVTDESIAYVAAAMITRSGWVFRPVLFEFQARA